MKRLSSILLMVALAAGCDSSAPLVPDAGALAPEAGAVTPDAAPGPDALRRDGPGPMANVYKLSPTEDNRQTSQVLLEELTIPGGALMGRYASVWNCVNEAGGPKLSIPLGSLSLTGSLCKVAQKAQRGADGSYLQIAPPAVDTDGGAPFAEVMMYHHVTSLGRYYSAEFGLTHVKKPLRAMVNLQGYLDLLGGWTGFPNAAYFPQEMATALKKLLGADLMNGEEAILFGYNSLAPPLVNFAFDASVIYHEYTHFSIGAGRLYLPAPDEQGLDPTPFALNEALADYMAASHLGRAGIGSYALGTQSRDLTRFFRCPDHIIGEEHNDGEIASGALWAVRAEVGAKVLDAALWKAILTFTASTTFAQAAAAIIDQVKQVAPAKEQAVRQIFEGHGMLGCVRLVPHQDFDLGLLASGSKPKVPGLLGGAVSFPDGAPAHLQYRVALADATREVTIEYAAEGEGFMGLPLGGGVAELWVALRKGSAPISYHYAGGSGSSDAQKVLKGEATASSQKLTLTGSCISQGDLVFQFLNRGSAAAMISRVKVTQSPTITQTTPSFDGC